MIYLHGKLPSVKNLRIDNKGLAAKVDADFALGWRGRLRCAVYCNEMNL